MSEEKRLKARVAHKHKTEANWRLDVYDEPGKLREDPFIPLNGEIVIFDEDENYDYKRLKLGNGITNVMDLPFIEQNIRNYIDEKTQYFETRTLKDNKTLIINTTNNDNQANFIEINGDTTLNGDLDVEGGFRVDMVDSNGAIGAINLYASGKNHTSSCLDISADDATVTIGQGAFTVDAATVNFINNSDFNINDKPVVIIDDLENAKTVLVGNYEDTANSDTIFGAKRYADAAADDAKNYTDKKTAGYTIGDEGSGSTGGHTLKIGGSGNIDQVGISANDVFYVDVYGEGRIDVNATKINLLTNKSTGSSGYPLSVKIDDKEVATQEYVSEQVKNYIPTAQKGAINGVATLNENGKVPQNQLPSYVDDVLEFDNKDVFPSTGENDKIYIAIDTNTTYRWGGTTYVPIGSDLALGDTENTAFDGKRGLEAYEHSQTTGGNPHNVTKEDLGIVDTYTNNEPLLKDMGGILANNHKNGFNNVPINDLITELLYPYTAPTISCSLNPTAGTKEMNKSITVNSATVTVTKKSKSLQSIKLYEGNSLIEEKTDGVASGGSFTFTINKILNGSTNTSYKATVTEAGENGATISSNNQTYNFVYPYFYGVVARGSTIDSEMILSFKKEIRAKGDHNYTYTTNMECPVIAYPKSYGALKSIVDPNNFTQNWTQYIVTIDSDTINDVDYYVYVGGAAIATNTTYKFYY